MDHRVKQRTYSGSVGLVATCLLLLSMAPHKVEATVMTTLYFANQSSIDRWKNNVATPIIHVGTLPLALDCNSCDDRIYWVNNNNISRSFTNDSNIETILDISLSHPKGVAVDWRSNLVYFTDQRENKVHVGVASCDGSYQQIFTQLDHHFLDAGPIVVDSLHGYMYYADVHCCIWKARMDGTDSEKIHEVTGQGFGIEDIAIDLIEGLLYWVYNGVVYRSDLNGENKEQLSIPDLQSPVRISITNGTLYWSRKRTNGIGSIFSYSLSNNSAVQTVITDVNLYPGDISTFVPRSFVQSVTGGCSSNNGGCSRFCFTLPDLDNPSDSSALYRCGCPSGFSLQSNNRSCNTVPLVFLVMAQASVINLLSLDIPEDSHLSLPLPLGIYGNVEYITFDRKFNFLYWAQVTPPAIVRSRIDGSGREVIVSESIALPVGVAINDDGSTLFWADAALNKIEVVSVSTTGGTHKRKVIVDTDLDHPQGIAINEALGYLYWTDSGLTPRVMRSQLDGSNQQTLINADIISPGVIIFPEVITVHPSTGDIYWTEKHFNNRAVWKANRNGGGRTKLSIPGSSEHVAGLTFLGDTLYWTDRLSGTLRSTNVASQSQNEATVSSHLPGVRGVFAINDTLALSDHGCLNQGGNCEDICIPTGTNSTRKCLCQNNYVLGGETHCVDDTTSHLLIATEESVFVATGTFFTFPIELPIPVRAMDPDVQNSMLYWVNNQDGNIYRSGFSHPNMSDYPIEHLVTCSYGNISDIAIDWWGRNLYWTNNVLGTVGVAKLNGENPQVLASGLSNPNKIVVNPYQSNLYISSDVGIQSIPLTGGPVTTIWLRNDTRNDLILDITIDIEEQILFWSHGNCISEHNILTNHTIYGVWCDFHYDGQVNPGPPPSVITYYNNRLYIVLPTVNQLYWYDEHSAMDNLHFHDIRCWSSIDCMGVHGANITSIKFSHYSIQPDTHWCARNNGECQSDSTLCLVKDHYYFECRCSPTKYKNLVYDPDREVCRTHCNTPNSFILLSTSSDILFLPVIDPRLTNSSVTASGCFTPSLQPQQLFLHNLSDVQSISYNPSTEKVQWINSNTVSSAFLNGSGQSVLAHYQPLTPYAMATDWLGGQMFWTDLRSRHIYVLQTSGRGSGVLLATQTSVIPTAVAMDTRGRYLYFSDRNSLSLKRISMAMPGFAPRQITPANVPSNRKLNILSMSYEATTRSLYWFDNITGVIERYNTTTNNVTSIVTGVANASDVTALTAVRRDSQLLLFWYNQSDWSVYVQDVTEGVTDATPAVYVQLSAGTIITSLISHDSANFEDVSSPCHNDNCSHICLVSGVHDDTSECACPDYRSLQGSSTCSDLTCSNGFISCNDQSSCILRSYQCDGVADCPDQSDERQCHCSSEQFECPSSGHCIDRDQLCDGSLNCVSAGEDEENCTSCNFSCSLKGVGETQCIPDQWLCDGMADCANEEDERNCQGTTVVASTTPFSSATPLVTPTSPAFPLRNVIIGGSFVVLVFILFLLCLMGVVLQCVISKRRGVTHTSRYDFPSSLKSSTSPQPHLRSINTSDLSINTMETGSTHVDKTSQEARIIKRLSTLSTDPSNPPNSPITTHRSIACMGIGDEEMSVLSRPYSEIEHPVPRVPNPSMNFDAISDNISSVSQHRLLAIYPPNGLVGHEHHLPPPTYHQPHILDYIDEDAITLDDQYNPQLHPLPHPLARLHMDNASENTCTIISMTTFNEPCTNFMSHHDEVPEGDMVPENSLPHAYDCPPPPSPVTEYSLH